MKFTFDGHIDLALIISTLGVIYAVFNEIRRWVSSRTNLTVRVISYEPAIAAVGSSYGAPVRMQIVNNSSSSIVISHIDWIDEATGNMWSGKDLKHFITMKSYKLRDGTDYQNPIFSTEFPVNVPANSGINIAVFFTGQYDIDNKSEATFKFLTNKKTLIVKNVPIPKDLNHFS
jgi:hypothetical protein